MPFFVISHSRGCSSRILGVASLLELYEEDDLVAAAGPFDIEKDVPKMYEVCFNMTGWSMETKVKNWAWLLFTISVFGRASCVTRYVPLIENLMFPTHAEDYDAAGQPLFVYVAFTDWKGRPKRFESKKYLIKIFRNHLDGRADPLFWLTLHLKYQGRLAGALFGETNGQPYKDTKVFTAMAQRIFNEAEMDCTPHSLRRTAFQFAGRCLGQIDKIKMNARHAAKSCEFMTYMEDGHRRRDEAMEHGKADPIWEFWVWKPATPNRQPWARDYGV
jgi:hypothetical protein